MPIVSVTLTGGCSSSIVGCQLDIARDLTRQTRLSFKLKFLDQAAPISAG